MNGTTVDITLHVNGREYALTVEGRTLLADLLRDGLGLTGTHIGCDTSQCGACTVLLDGKAVKSCTVLAAQADGCEVITIEGIGTPDALHPVQAAFREEHGLQCGFCTPGVVMTAVALLSGNPDPSEREIRLVLDGVICRCTGYENIVRSVRTASAQAAPAKARAGAK